MIENETKRFIPLKFDLMFKKVFANEEDLIPIRKLLKEVLGIVPKSVKILNSELIGRPYKDKKVEVDLIVELDDGTKVNIEINTYENKSIINRNVYYICRNISKDLSKSNEYDEINRHIQINLDYSVMHTNPIMKYRLYDKEAEEELTDMMEIIKIYIPYFKDRCYNEDVDELDSQTKFLGLLGVESSEEAKKLCNGDEDMEDIYDNMKKYNDEMDVMGAYDWEFHQNELKRQEIKDATEAAIKEGHEQGIESTAKNLLKENIDISIISKVTGMTIEEINKLKES